MTVEDRLKFKVILTNWINILEEKKMIFNRDSAKRRSIQP